MTPRALYILFFVALISSAAAIWSLAKGPAVFTAGAIDEPAFPALRVAPESVASLVLESADGHFTLERTEEGWIAPEKGGFSANDEKIRRIIASLSDMRLVEAKTRRPELYGRLDLANLEEDPKSKVKHLSLADSEGQVLAEAFFGKKLWRRTGNERSGIYLRRPDDKRAWLAGGGETMEASLSNWLAQEILDIRSEEFRRIEIAPVGEQAYEIFRSAAGEPFLLPDLPVGRSVAISELDRVAGTLAGLNQQDVRSRAEVGLSPLRDPKTLDRATFETLDGKEIMVARTSVGDESWMSFSIKALAGADEKAKEEAEKLNARLAPWAFKVPGYVAERIGTPMESLLETP